MNFDMDENFQEILNMSNEGIEAPNDSDDSSVDILGFPKSLDTGIVAKEDPDATENSSSFGDMNSGNEINSGLSDTEVESQFFSDNNLAPSLDGFGSIFPTRKKKVTAHWRNYIRPLMWRCKWTELKIKQLESLSAKYDREIALFKRNKHKADDQITVEQNGSRSIPYTYRGRRKMPLKRRKRNRVENTTDIALYMANHNLFSERENKKPDLDGVLTWEDLDNSDQNTTARDEFELEDDYLFPEEENDNYLEQILSKIELMHTRVHNLKAQLDLAMINNAAKFSSSENLSQLMTVDSQMSPIHSPPFSACNEDDAFSTGGGVYMISDYDLGDFIMPDITIPDVIESTVGLLSCIDVTEQQVLDGDTSEKIVDNIPLPDEVAELEESTFDNILNQSAENSGGEDSNHGIHLPLEHDLEPKSTIVTQEQSILKSCLSSDIHFPKNKRKRGERKAGSANWSRQRPGEPDN